MRKTFVCDESIIITVPTESLVDAQQGPVMPQKLISVFKDRYKIFVRRGRPNVFGAAQAIAGVFVFTLGLIVQKDAIEITVASLSLLFVITGILTFAAGHFPNMYLSKMSLCLNIIGFFWSFAVVCLYVIGFTYSSDSSSHPKLHVGLRGIIITLLAFEVFIALFLVFWLNKTVCRQHFNTLPVILLKYGH
ncbi:uncharacterized protein ACBR49_005536 [Aulostomus maculatus]